MHSVVLAHYEFDGSVSGKIFFNCERLKFITPYLDAVSLPGCYWLQLSCRFPRQTMGLEGAPRCVAPRVGVPTEGIASLGQIDGLQGLMLSLLSIPDARGKCKKLCSNWGMVFLGEKNFAVCGSGWYMHVLPLHFVYFVACGAL